MLTAAQLDHANRMLRHGEGIWVFWPDGTAATRSESTIFAANDRQNLRATYRLRS